MIRGIGVAEFDAKRGSILVDCRPRNIASEEALSQIKADAVELEHEQLTLKRERDNLAIHVQHVQVLDPSVRGGKRLYAVLIFTDLNQTLSAKELKQYRSDFEKRIADGGSNCIEQFVSTHALKIAVDDLFEHRLPSELKDTTCAIFKTDNGELLRSSITQSAIPYVKSHIAAMREMQKNAVLFTPISVNQHEELLVTIKVSSDISAAFLSPYPVLQGLLGKIPQYAAHLGGDQANVEHFIDTLIPKQTPGTQKQPSQPQLVPNAPSATAIKTQDIQPPSTMLIKVGDASGSKIIETTIDMLSSLQQRVTIPPTCILFYEEEPHPPSGQNPTPASSPLQALLSGLAEVASTYQNAIFAKVKVDSVNKKRVTSQFSTPSVPCIVVVDSPSPAATKRTKLYPLPKGDGPAHVQVNALLGEVKQYLNRLTAAQLTKTFSSTPGPSRSRTFTQLPYLITETTILHVKRGPSDQELADDHTKIVWHNILDGMPLRDLFKACKLDKLDPPNVKAILLRFHKQGIIDLKEML